jgi:hypothetical protein
MWNKLSGYEGNLQYLYETIENYSLNDYYAYGFYNPQIGELGTNSFIIYTFPLPEIEVGIRVDERPDDVEAQFYDEDNYSNIKIQKSGIYIINTHVLPFNQEESSPDTQFSLSFERNEEISSLTETVESNGASFPGLMQITPNPINYYSIRRLNEGDVITPVVSAKSFAGIGRLQEFTGTWFSSAYPFAKTPYVSSLFMVSPRINIDIPSAFFYFAANLNYLLIENTSIEIWANSTNQSLAPLTSGDVASNKYLGWNFLNQSNNKSYVYPFNDSPLTTSIAYFEQRQALGRVFDGDYIDSEGLNLSKNARYIIIGIKSFNATLGFTPGIEQNIFSFIIPNNYENITQNTKPVTLSATTDGTNITLWFRVYERIHQIQFSDLTDTSEVLIAIEFTQFNNNQYIYEPKIIINNKTIITDSGDDSKIISLANTVTVPATNSGAYKSSYDMKRVSGISICGTDFYSASDNQANLSSHIGYYFIGDWFFDDEVAENSNTILQKEFIWDYLSNHYNVSLLDYNYIVTSGIVDDAIILDQFQFGDDGRFI